MKNKATGFTLTEIVIAVAIVAILATVAYPSYVDSVRKGRRAQARADLLLLTEGLERFHTVSATYDGFDWPYIQSPTTGTAYYNLGDSVAPTATTYTIQAVPIGAQASDVCGTLKITNTGRKTFTGASGSVGQCW